MPIIKPALLSSCFVVLKRFFLLFPFFTFAGCKSAEPIGTMMAEPVEIAFVKGPAAISYGKLYFLEEEAVYKPYKWYFINFQKVRNFPYAKIDTVEKAKLLGLLPVMANLKMKDGKKYKIRMYHQRNLDTTLNNLKH